LALGTYEMCFSWPVGRHWASSLIFFSFLFFPFSLPSFPILNLRRSRRICPGIHVAERELWLAISRLLWAYDIRSLPDEPISLEEYDGESGRTPLPYRITLTPRHDGVQALLEAEEEVTLMKL
jgi:hypothetical protein